MQRSILFGWIAALAIVAAVVGYWLLRAPGEGARAATATPAAPRESPVFLRDPDAPSESAPAARAEAEPAPASPTPASPATAERATKLEAVLTGRTVDRAHRPLTDVRIASKYPVLDARSDAHGRFELHCPLAGDARQRRVALVFTLASFGVLKLDATADADQPNELGDLVLTPAGAISGRTVDEHGQAFAQAEVLVTNVDVAPVGPAYYRPHQSLVEGGSDAAGNFRLADVPAGQVRVWAGADDHLWAASEPLEVPEHGELFDVVLTVRAVERDDLIRMTVVDPDGAPVPRANIAYHAERGGSSWSGSTNADEHGRYTLYVSTRVPHDFSASDPEQRYGAAQAKAVEPGTLDLVLRLMARRVLTLTVVSASGTPVEKFAANLREVGDKAMPQMVFAASEPHEGGRLELAIPAVPFEIAVDAQGFAVATLGPFEPASAPSELRATLTPLPGVRGIVRAGGKPVAGAEVTLNAAIGDNTECVVNGFPARSQSGGDSATSGADGSFVVTLRKSQRCYVRAELGGWAPAEIGPLDVEASTGASELVLDLTDGGTVEGRATPGAGETLGGLIIGASRGDGCGVTTRTDVEGRFRFARLTPGRWWIGRHGEEISPSSTTSSTSTVKETLEIPWNCVVREGETTRVDVPAPTPDPVRLRGRLAFGGAGAKGWTATLSPVERAPDQNRKAILDAQGRFELSTKAPGKFQLVVSPDGTYALEYGTIELALDNGANEWELDVPAGTILGRLPAGANADQAQYEWSWKGADGFRLQGSCVAANDGSFTIANAPAGAIEFSRWSNGNGSATLKTVELTAGATLRVDL